MASSPSRRPPIKTPRSWKGRDRPPSSDLTSGNTPTTSSIRTAGQTTSAHGGTQSTGMKLPDVTRPPRAERPSARDVLVWVGHTRLWRRPANDVSRLWEGEVPAEPRLEEAPLAGPGSAGASP